MKEIDTLKRCITDLDGIDESRNLSDLEITRWWDRTRKNIDMENIKRLDLK